MADQVLRNELSQSRALNLLWHRLGVTEPLQTRIGIDTGVLSVSSFGSEGRIASESPG